MLFPQYTSLADRYSQNHASPTKFSSQATDSPSKVNVPRRQRNQASKTDDIEFAAEITTSLLGQVRHLQGVLQERDEALKTINSEKSKLELEAEGFSQRLRSLDESEQRYKDENWNLETQAQESNAAAREAANREQKLQQSLAFATAEKNNAQRELDELRQDHSKMTEDHAVSRKTHDSELAGLRKTVNVGESEKAILQRKIEDLTSQNRELANGLAGRFRDDGMEPEADVGQSEQFPLDLDREHSPPPSPTKGTQRHSMLESETLKSSLHHAHRMIQSLKGNIHREKSEKQDLKRLLQEARDELEIRRAEPSQKRTRSKSHTDKQRPGRPGLGAARHSRTNITLDDAEWEDHNGINDRDNGPRAVPKAFSQSRALGGGALGESSDAYQTANETEDAFETANERDITDNDAFQTGAESMAGDSSNELTETEDGVARGGTVRSKRPSPLATAKPGDRRSIQSTASTSGDEPEHGSHTPVQGQPQRFRLRVNRNSRHSRVGSTPTQSSNPASAKNSPASFTNGGGDVSLFNELENLSGDEIDGTPSKGSISSPRSIQPVRRSLSDKRSSSSMRRGITSQPSTPGPRPNTMVYAGETPPPVPRIPTVDSGMMTEPWKPAEDAGSAPTGFSPHPGPSSETSSVLPTSSAAAITNRIFGGTPYTPPNKGLVSPPASGSDFGSRRSSNSTQPRPAWDQPLQVFSGGIPGFGQSTETLPLSTRSSMPQVRDVARNTFDAQKPRHFSNDHAYAAGLPVRAQPTLALSPIHSLETAPVERVQRPVVEGSDTATRATESTASGPSETDNEFNRGSTGGIFGTVFSWSRPKSAVPIPQMAGDETSRDLDAAPGSFAADGKTPLAEVPPNLITPNARDRDISRTGTKAQGVYMSDHGAQTLLSSEQIDTLLSQKAILPPVFDNQKNPAAAAMKPLSAIGAVSPPQGPRYQEPPETTRGKGPEMVTYKDSLGKTFKRPVSSTSMRSRSAQQYPPLPPDHQEAIAAAASRAPSTEPVGSMGPPLAPASAYISKTARSRQNSRPQTPSQQGLPSPSSKGGTTPRAGRYSTTRSQVSRRSSFSSFASELDERFNIRTEGMPMPHGVSANTDPRMIQAITQTMIGEMMWKYTRKAGRGEMSSTRHRRFFWVHPYTRTLYWSDRDPATADRAQLKSKSVAIEAVRVVTDDNPMPPGLHRKSLIIITPGRSVKFTAQTSQRHETWFNALSYLLLRTGPDGTDNTNDDLTDTDVNEFNPQNRRKSGSRVSLASFSSKRAQNRQDQTRLSARGPPASNSAGQSGSPYTQYNVDEPHRESRTSMRSRISRSLSRSRGGKAPDTTDHTNEIKHEKHGSVASRRSGFMGSVRNSMRSRSSMRRDEEEPHQLGVREGGRSVVAAAGADSAEDLRRVIEEREQGGRLENVRACCDGETTLPSSPAYVAIED